MSRNIALRLSYDGSRYHGWQEQPRDVTVAGTLTAAISRVCGDVTHVTGCGRTDAGVHALRYCANFRTASTIPAERIPLAVNTLLPPDIAVSHAIDAQEDFNAILSCVKKEYTYKIVNSRLRDPFLHNRAYFYARPLDLGAMSRAAGFFVGTHDFAAVRSVGTETKTTVRTVHWCEVVRDGAEVTIRVCADGFLYNMVRAIVGTLLYVSEGKIAVEDIPRLLESGDRRLAGPTVPPSGLYLSRIWYDGDVGEMMSE
ncbi:MAG: tRNA pseudouridine(38-40) synthase TruA [Oscillospiraceae bacterium]|nr:tRNA pseudouridine(38-40) synthase TruA [Oscillospiraceae bacterium]